MKKIITIALVFRLLISFFTAHPDTKDFLGWSKDINKNGLSGIYQRDIDDAGPANYPHLYYFYLALNNKAYDTGKYYLWLLNLNIRFFPSEVYLYFESDNGNVWFNKIIPILFDVACGYLIYKIVKTISSKNALTASMLYLFLPPSWYVSSLWGQIDSIYIYFTLLSVFLLVKKRISISIFLMAISVLVKPNAVFIFPVYFLYLLKDGKFIALLKGILASFAAFILPAAYFSGSLNIFKISNFYFKYVREISGYISSNAFNVWGMVYGYGPNFDSKTLLGISIFWWGIFLYLVFMTVILKAVAKDRSSKNIFTTLLLVSFSSFLFLTRMHERYFFLTYVFMLIVFIVYKNFRKYLYLATTVFFLNLYHYWWYPYSGVLKLLFSVRFVEVFLTLIYLWVFFKTIKLNSLYEKEY